LPICFCQTHHAILVKISSNSHFLSSTQTSQDVYMAGIPCTDIPVSNKEGRKRKWVWKRILNSTGGLCLHAMAGVVGFGIIATTNADAAHKEGNMVAWFKFDEGTGTAAADSSGNNNGGTLVGSPAWVDGFDGKALQFNNTDKTVEIASFSGINAAAEFSVSAWVKVASMGTAATEDGAVFSTKSTTDPTIIWFNADGAGGYDPSYTFNVGNTGTASNRINGPSNIVVQNKWQHLVCVFNGASRKIYLDGALRASSSNGAHTTETFNGKTFQIGRWQGSTNMHFNGLIDEVRVYDIALTDSDVTTIYGNGAGDFGLPPTLTINGGEPATAIPVGITAEFLDGATAKAVTGFDLSDITIEGGTASNFAAVSGSKYTFDIIPSSVPSFVGITVANASANITADSLPSGGAKKTFLVEDRKPVAFTSISANKALSAGNLSLLNDGVIPAGNVGGDAWNGGKYAAVNADADFIFSFPAKYKFSKVKLDYQNWDDAANFGTLAVYESVDGLVWFPFSSGIQTRNGLNREPLAKEIDLSGLDTQYVKLEMKRAPGNWWGPILGEVSFWAHTGPEIAIDGSQIYANISKPYNYNIPADGATTFASSNLPNWVSLNTATGNLSGTAPATISGTVRPDLIPGLNLWLDANSIMQETGSLVTEWEDLSGKRHHADNVQGTPTLGYGPSGLAAISFEAATKDLLWTTYDFGGMNQGYTIFAVSRYAGDAKYRLISSKNQNWIFGYHNNGVARFYANGWISNLGPSDNVDWHLHSGGIDNAADPIATFWLDGVNKIQTANGSNNSTYKPGQMSFGGLWYGSNNEYSDGQVSEVIMYQRVLSQDERESIEGYLAQKYGLSHPQSSKDLTSTNYPLTFDVLAGSSGGVTSKGLKLSLLDIPAITALDATEAQLASAIANGNVTAVNDTVDATVKVYFGTADGGTDPGAWDRVLTAGILGVGNFSKKLKGLASDTTYFYRFTITNRGTFPVWSDVKTFDTLPSLQKPKFDPLTITELNFTKAKINLNITDNGGEDPSVTLYWGGEDAGTDTFNWQNKIEMGRQSVGNVVIPITGLSAPTIYFARTAVTNAAGTTWPEAAAVVVPPVSPYTKGTKLEAYYKFDEASGAVGADSSGKGRDGTVYNSAAFVAGKFGNALDFGTGSKTSNDTTGHWFEPASFEWGGHLAISAWVWYDSYPNWSRILDFGNGTADNILLANVGTGNQGYWSVRNGPNNREIRNNSYWETGRWIHVVASNDTDGNLRFYKDGVLRQTATGQEAKLLERSNRYIGRSNWNDNYFDGKIDDLRLYSGGLTQDDIDAIYGGGSGETPITAPNITSAATASGTVGQAFSYVIATDAATPVFGAWNLPPGLSLSGPSISGTPTAGGTFNTTVTVSTTKATASQVVTITIPASPSLVKALPATNVLASSARVNGEVQATGGDAPTVTLFYGATDAQEDVNGWNLSLDLGVKGKEVFNVDLASLFLNKQYFYRFRAVNSAGTSWSLTQSLTTILADDFVATDITTQSVSFDGTLVSTGGATTEIIVHWGTQDKGKTDNGWDYSISLGNRAPGFFSWEVEEGFAAPTIFTARLEAKNSVGSVWDGPVYFTALPGKTTKFRKDAVADIAFWLDASDIDSDGGQDSLLDGDVVGPWRDKSGHGRDAGNFQGDPTYVKSGPNGLPTINYDGNDSHYTTQKFNTILGDPGHTIFTFARYAGGQSNRVFSTRDGRNWLFGFHGNTVTRYYSDGWIANVGGTDTSWHLHIGDIQSRNEADPLANFWRDGTQYATNNAGSHNTNTYPTDFQIGGFGTASEYSKAEVSEVMFFGRILTQAERELVEGYIAHKYDHAGVLPDGHAYKDLPPLFDAEAPDIHGKSVVRATKGQPWEYKILATNGATSYSAYGLPGWITMTGNKLSGTPPADGDFEFSIAASNTEGSSIQKLTVRVTDYDKWPYSQDFTTKPLANPASDLVLHWKLDEETNTGAVDSSNSGNDGTLTGGTNAGQVGKFGKAYQFDGVDDKVNKSLASNTTLAEYTLMFWVKPTYVAQSDGTGVFNSGNTGADFEINLTNNSWQYSGDVAGDIVIGQATQDWTHITVVCDGTNTLIYLDATLVAQAAGTIDNVFQHYRLGANRTADNHFDGMVDDFRVYDKALTQTKIQAASGVPLEQFPLLVRLRESENGFQYSQVKSLTGAEVRFITTSGVELPHVFEKWDPEGESLIWVRMDKVDVGTGTTFQMRWGNPAVKDFAETSTDGSTWAGYSLANYMDAGNYLNDQAPDLGANVYHEGIQNQTVSIAGLIADARNFSLNDNRVEFHRSNPPKNYSFSAWYRMPALPTAEMAFFYTRNWSAGDTRARFLADGTLRWEVNTGSPTNQYIPAGVLVADDLDKWIHYAASYDSERKRFTFYKNGEQIHTSDIPNPTPPRLNSWFHLGTHEGRNAKEFVGDIDQWEIHDTARNEAWFKASLEAEKKGSDFLSISNYNGPPEWDGEISINGLIYEVGGNLVSEAVSYTIPVKGQPDTFGAVGLPAGLSINNNGVVSGTPLAGGTTPVTISATGRGATITKNVTVKVTDLTKFTHTMTLTFSNYSGSSALMDFPMLVELGTHLSNFSYNSFLTELGGDLRFYDATPGSATVGQELEYEVEKWDVDGKSQIWIRVPTLDANTKVIAAWANPDDKELPAYRYTGNTWSGGFAGVYHLAPVNFLGKYIDSGLNFAHGDDVNMPATSQSYIDSAANFTNSTIEVPHVGSLSTLNRENYSISVWAKLKGSVNATASGLNEWLFDGNFNDTHLDPIDSGSGFLSGAVTPIVTNILVEDRNIDLDGNYINSQSGGRSGTDSIGAVWEGLLVIGGNSPVTAGAISFGTRSDDGSVLWVDANQNGTFDAGEMVVNNKGGHGAQNRTGTVTLADGQYKFATGWYEGGGGEYMGVRWAQGTVTDYNLMNWVNPISYPGMFLAPNPGMPIVTHKTGFGLYYAPDNKIRGRDRTSINTIATGSAVNLDEWNHIFMTVERATSTLRVYLNGAEDAVVIHDAVTEIGAAPGVQPFIFGDAGQANFDLDEIRFSTRARSADWVKAEYDNQKASQTLLGYAAVTGPPRLVSKLFAEFSAGTNSTYQIQATGSPSGYAALNLPGGMSVDLDTGLVSGTPTVAGEFAVTLQVIYPDGTILSESLALKVNASAPVVESAAPSEVTATSVKVNGSVVNSGGDFPEVLVFYGTSDGANDPSAWNSALDIGRQSAVFSEFLGDLTPETTYYYRVQATNSAGTVWDGSASWFSTFDGVADDALSALVGTASIDLKEKELALTSSLNNQTATAYLPDLNPGNATPNFNASFNLFQGPGSDNPEDSMAFYYGPLDGSTNLGGDAAVDGLKVRFKVQGTDYIIVSFNQTQVAAKLTPLLSNKYVPVTVSASRSPMVLRSSPPTLRDGVQQQVGGSPSVHRLPQHRTPPKKSTPCRFPCLQTLPRPSRPRLPQSPSLPITPLPKLLAAPLLSGHVL
jgi:hypothetical protein